MNDNKNNFYLKINLYIIRAIYKKLGKKLCSDFIENDNNRKVAHTKFHEILGVDQQRLNRIITTKGNNKIFDKEAEKISKIFNIDKRYFLNDKEYVLYGNIKEIEWAIFFEDEYKNLDGAFGKHLSLDGYGEQGVLNKSGEIKKKIESFVDQCIKDCENNQIERGCVIHRIYWYFTQGTAYDGNLTDSIKQNIRELENVTNGEWKEIDEKSLKDIISRVDKLQNKLKALQNAQIYRFI